MRDMERVAQVDKQITIQLLMEQPFVGGAPIGHIQARRWLLDLSRTINDTTGVECAL